MPRAIMFVHKTSGAGMQL